MSKFFKVRDPWVLMYPDVSNRQKAFEQVNFHREALKQVKASLGAKCTYLVHQMRNGKLSFKAYMLVGGKKKIISVSEGVPAVDDLTAEDYKKLKVALDEHTRS
jgi:hypothetical protein